jgi:hypothetical protein
VEGEVKTIKLNSTITWTPKLLAHFKPVYQRALEESGRDGKFIFRDHEFHVGFAGYLIEYLEGQWSHD